MGEDTQPLTTEDDVRTANRGILVVMAGVAVVIIVIAGAINGPRGALAAGLGGVLAWLNYRWLDSSTRAIMVDPTTATTPILAMRFVLRYLVIAAVLFPLWLYGILPVAWSVAALGSFAIAVMLRGLKSIFTDSR